MMGLMSIAKKWYVILICAVLCALGLYFEKSRVQPPVPQSGDMTYIRIVKFDVIPSYVVQHTGNEFVVENLVKVWPNLSDLTNELETNFEMNRLNIRWDNLSQSQRYKWLNTHFNINRVGPGTYELTLRFSKNDPKDFDYIQDNQENLLDVYTQYIQQTTAEVVDNTKLTTVKGYQLVENADAPTQAGIEKKYAAIGFVLGGLAGVIIVMAWNGWKMYGKRNAG